MNLLVTGGAGFIGSHFVLRHVAARSEDTVIVLDKLTYAADKSLLDPVKGKIVFAEGDIVDIGFVNSLVTTHAIDTIINFAAETHVDRSIESAVPFIHSNILGVESLIEVCKAHPALRLMHISTDEVFGDIADSDPPRKVGDALWPSSPYAASKAAGEMLLVAAMRTYGIKAAITRCTNNFGPHQAEEKFIPTVIRHALEDKPIPIYAQGKNKRDWLYVTDHTDALEMILAEPELFEIPGLPEKKSEGSSQWSVDSEKTGHWSLSTDHFFHISADNERQNIDVAKAILQILGKPESLISFVKDRPGHDWRYALDSSNTRALGWKPSVTFEEGLQKTVEWYRLRM